MSDTLTLATIADGALEEQFKRCLEEVRESYRDETRDEKGKRVIKLELTFSRRPESNLIEVTTESSVKLPATRGAMGFVSDEGDGFEAVALPKARQEELFKRPAAVLPIGGRED
ncbi:MAG: hypothetical protein WC789_10420 [Lentisphaeria bacterium]